MKNWEPVLLNKQIIKSAKERIDIINNIIIEKSDSVEDLTLYTGKLGICLFLYYYSLVNKKNNIWEEYFYNLNTDISNLSTTNCDYYVTCNINFAWLLSHLYKIKALDIADIDIYLKEYDEIFYDLMKKYIKDNSYDLLYGATQIATYFLNRYKHKPEKYKKFLNAYLELLYTQADKLSHNKLAWKSMIDKSAPHILGYNLGLAHGIPSLIMFFSKLIQAGFQHPLLNEILTGTCKYMLSIEQDFQKYKSHFGIRLLPGQKKNEMSRIGWCYGDLGIGYAFLHASKYDENKKLQLKNKSIEIIEDTFNRISQKETLIVDNCLCHGTSGVALIYDMISKNLNDQKCKKLASYWYTKTIEQSFDYNYYAGYKIYKGNYKYESDLSFLSGISGIGLSLISAIYPVKPDWCEFIMLC